jgi:ribose-phosphate pyrophosphokinase
VIDFVRYVNPDKIPLTLVVPDAGALKKCQKLLDITGLFVKMIVCHKTRVGHMVVCNDIEEDLDGQDAIVIDDICDGGRTFIELAKKLKERNVGNLSLFVSHGIFSAGINALSSHYGQIGTTNSMNSEGLTSMGVKCFELDY